MDGNNGIDPDAHGDVDHNVGTLPVWDYVLDPVTHANRLAIRTPDYYGRGKPLIDFEPYKHFDRASDWNRPGTDEYGNRDYGPKPDPLRNFFADWAAKPNWDIFPVSDADLISDGKPDAEPNGIFHYNTHPNGDIILKFDSNSITYAIIKRHLEAAYAEIAATLLGEARYGEKGDPDTEAKAASEADVAFDCWS